MADTQFQVSITNLDKLTTALARYPEVAVPIVQAAIVGAQALLAKHTTGATVPIKTGYLVQNWAFEVGNLQARWYPKAAYAPYVEFGSRPHTITAVNKKVLANVRTGQVFGPVVHHPGTKANPFMERIVAAAQPEIDDLFTKALAKITSQIASQSQ